jgi:hypothetical protein
MELLVCRLHEVAAPEELAAQVGVERVRGLRPTAVPVHQVAQGHVPVKTVVGKSRLPHMNLPSKLSVGEINPVTPEAAPSTTMTPHAISCSSCSLRGAWRTLTRSCCGEFAMVERSDGGREEVKVGRVSADRGSHESSFGRVHNIK